jgi:hypothetical protein
MKTHKEVTQKEFFDKICSMTIDVHPRCEGNWPYTSIFEDRSRVEHGRIEPILETGPNYKNRYLLVD